MIGMKETRMCILKTTQLVVIMEVRSLNFNMRFLPKDIRKEREGNVLQGYIRKINPTTFDGVKLGEVVKIWLVEMKKYL